MYYIRKKTFYPNNTTDYVYYSYKYLNFVKSTSYCSYFLTLEKLLKNFKFMYDLESESIKASLNSCLVMRKNSYLLIDSEIGTYLNVCRNQKISKLL